jgi:diketogulonate reductase-like aldo/keto reductase
LPLERLVADGLVRHVGVVNVNRRLVDALRLLGERTAGCR